MLKHLRASLMALFLWTILTGVLYPLAVTAIAAALFPTKATGSLLHHEGKWMGSALIGQHFDDPKYFWGRPSATASMPYNAAASSGSNLGPINPALWNAVKERIKFLRQADPDNTSPIPVDLVTASGSGLDAHVSPAAAEYQVRRVARVRGMTIDQIRKLVTAYTQGRQFGVLGEPCVNILRLNLALDGINP